MKTENKTNLIRFIVMTLVAVLFIFAIARTQRINEEKESLEEEYTALKEDVSRWHDSVCWEHEWLVAGLIDSANLDLAYGKISKDEHTVRMHEIAEISDYVESEPPHIIAKQKRMEEIENKLKNF